MACRRQRHIDLATAVREAAALSGWHPSDASLAALIEGPGRFDPHERRRVAAHLEVCPPCRDAVVAVAALADD
jgi:anti-sigma factor RsiW